MIVRYLNDAMNAAHIFIETVRRKDYGTHSKNSKNSKLSIRKPQIFIFEKFENRIFISHDYLFSRQFHLAVTTVSCLYKPTQGRTNHSLMSSLGKSTSDIKFQPYKNPTKQTWVPTNAALNAALTRIENALDILDRLADAIEKHLGMGG